MDPRILELLPDPDILELLEADRRPTHIVFGADKETQPWAGNAPYRIDPRPTIQDSAENERVVGVDVVRELVIAISEEIRMAPRTDRRDASDDSIELLSILGESGVVDETTVVDEPREDAVPLVVGERNDWVLDRSDGSHSDPR